MGQQIHVQQHDFSVDEIYTAMRRQYGSEVGAIASFVGLVRDHNMVAGDGGDVQTLTLEHYPGMTEKSIQKILDQAEARWPLIAIHVVHRVGTMAPSEQIVLVMVASAHRDAAFAGAQYVMDCLKTEAVFWKNEQSDLGRGWVESTDADKVRAKLWNK
ncbi:molybdenum cofactor biosynthesis protein MoaE [Pseudomonadales bacterium]|nr:molybdenum cofactor biosynthesis protein MoaE [Pseudomonadales bacterium]